MLRLSDMEEGKRYKADSLYWFNAVFYRLNGRLHYELDNGKTYDTTYDMYPGLNNCRYYEHVEGKKEEKPVEQAEKRQGFLDDYIDAKLKEYDKMVRNNEHNYMYTPPSIARFLGMTDDQWMDYISNRLQRAESYEGL